MITRAGDFGVRDLGPGDHDPVQSLIAAAFAQADEAELVEAVRESGDVLFELVAETAQGLAGHILFCRGRIESELSSGDRFRETAILGEMAVAPDRQNSGIGAALLHAGLARLDDGQEAIVFVVGHPDYYDRFGFTAAAAKPFSCKWQGPTFMARIAEPQDWMSEGGFLHFPEPYDHFE